MSDKGSGTIFVLTSMNNIQPHINAPDLSQPAGDSSRSYKTPPTCYPSPSAGDKTNQVM